MAYEVTATLRRPQLFDALAGQEFVSKALKSSIENGKIAHAYLFAGPRGCGKTSTARILAKSLNCDKGPTATPCGECTHCREITAGSSLDVIEIDGASNTSVNDVRQIKDEVMFPPNSSRYKVYIIDEVHMLSTSAFNALLKTIEEPPPHVVFIFATTETQKVPATIKSRCQQFNFRLVSIDDIAALLKAAAKDEGIEADDEALYWVARQGGGSVRDAYTLFDQVSSFSEGHITYDKIKSHLGLAGIDRLNEIFEHCAAGRSNEALEAVNEALSEGVSVEQLIIDLSSYIRSILLIKSGVTKDSLLGEAKGRYSQAVLESWSTVQVERALSLLLQLYRDVRYSLSPKCEVELAISRLSWLKDYVSPKEVKSAIDAVRPLLSGVTPAAIQQQPNGAENAFNNNSNVQYSAASAAAPDIADTSSAPQYSPPRIRVPNGLPVFSALKGQGIYEENQVLQGGNENSPVQDKGAQGEGNTASDTRPFENTPNRLAGGGSEAKRPNILADDGPSESVLSSLAPSASPQAATKESFQSSYGTGDKSPPSFNGASESPNAADGLPPQVRILRDMFRGQVTITKQG